jgi:hypothetical protein
MSRCGLWKNLQCARALCIAVSSICGDRRALAEATASREELARKARARLGFMAQEAQSTLRWLSREEEGAE